MREHLNDVLVVIAGDGFVDRFVASGDAEWTRRNNPRSAVAAYNLAVEIVGHRGGKNQTPTTSKQLTRLSSLTIFCWLDDVSF